MVWSSPSCRHRRRGYRFRRAPLSYFHNGFAAVVAFYDDRFAMHLSAAEKSDLVAFLRSL
jgi:hypothetical protein